MPKRSSWSDGFYGLGGLGPLYQAGREAAAQGRENAREFAKSLKGRSERSDPIGPNPIGQLLFFVLFAVMAIVLWPWLGQVGFTSWLATKVTGWGADMVQATVMWIVAWFVAMRFTWVALIVIIAVLWVDWPSLSRIGRPFTQPPRSTYVAPIGPHRGP